MTERPKTGSPYDRGAADAYYGRPRRPHKWICGDPFAFSHREVLLTHPTEIAEYEQGYEDEPDGRKDWR